MRTHETRTSGAQPEPAPPAREAPAPSDRSSAAAPPGNARLLWPWRRRSVRRRAARHAKLSLPALGATVGGGTPGTAAMETAFEVEANRVLDRALAAAQPLRQRRRALLEWISHGETAEAEAAAVRDRVAPGPARERIHGEEHLTDAALADRVRREYDQVVERARVDAHNQRTLLTERRVELGRVDARLDGLVDAALVAVDAVRLHMLDVLHEYVDELVLRHPDGPLLGGLTWPASFAPLPAWAQDPERLRSMVRGPVTGADDARA